MRRLVASVVVAIVALALTACAGMPTTGSVQQGLAPGTGDESLELAFRPASPQRGATPEQIVQGFIAAGTSPAGNWAIAREFLAPAIAQQWDPDAGVTVDDLARRQWLEVTDTAFQLTVSPVAGVDDTGAYAERDAGTSTLGFDLAKQSDGQWRITKVDDGVVLDRTLFPKVFRAYPLMFFDPGWHYLVPDVRWFAARDNTATRIVRQLIDGGPSPWLVGAVATAFPDEIDAPNPVVVTSEKVAQIEVPPATLGLSTTQLGRMQAQLEATLASANITDAVMTVGTVDIDVAPAVTRSTRVDVRPAVRTKDGFGFLAGSELQPIAGISQAMDKADALQGANAIELSPDRDFAAVRVPSGAVVRVKSDQKFADADTRGGLVRPTVDGLGYIWTVPANRPSAVVVQAADGTTTSVADAWGEASRIRAMQLSRDGTRIVALVDIGGRSEAWIAGVLRDKSVPVRLGQWIRLATLPSAGIDVAWLDDSTVGIVTSADGEATVLTQAVGGLSSTSGLQADLTTIVGGSQLAAVRVLASDGVMSLKTGARWQGNATGILVLATQQGAPQ
jgi:hypothetical protein